MSAADVLARIEAWWGKDSPDYLAVAELIAQRDMMANALATYRKAGVGNSTDFSLQIEASQLAGIALARVGGAS